MAKFKKDEAKCILCERIYSLTDGNAYSSDFCHVRCRNEHKRAEKAKQTLEKKMAKALQGPKFVVECLACSISFTTDYKSKRYCNKFCRDKYRSENQKPNDAKKKISSAEINQRLEFSRVKKNQGPSLKQYNAVRG